MVKTRFAFFHEWIKSICFCQFKQKQSLGKYSIARKIFNFFFLEVWNLKQDWKKDNGRENEIGLIFPNLG